MLRSIFFLQALIAISWLLNVHCSTEVQHSVEISRFPKHLNEDDFKIIENVESWIVVFHVEWCGHCKHLLPLLEKIANSPDHEQGIKIGLVNCSESPQLCERYSVKSYPTMLYHIPLISPKWEKYFGLRSEAGLKNFFRKVGQVSSLQVLKIENLPTKPVNPRGVVFAFNNLDKVALEAIRASLSLDEADFAVIEQKNSTESSEPNYVTLISDVFDGKNLVRKHQEPWDSQAIHEFIVRNKVRTFEKSSAANFESVLMRPLSYLIILVVSTTMKLEDTNVVVEAARNLAVDLRDDEEFSFTFVDGDIWPSFLEVFKIKVPLFPFIIAYHPRFEGYVFNSTFTSDVLHPAVKHGDSKRITAILKSAVEDIRSGKEPLIPLNFGAWLSSYARPLTGQIIDVVRASIQSETMFIAFFFVTSILFLGAIVLIIIIIFLLIKRGSSRGKSKMSNKDKKKN